MTNWDKNAGMTIMGLMSLVILEVGFCRYNNIIDLSFFGRIRSEISYNWVDLYYDPAFHLDDPKITSVTLTQELDQGARRCRVVYDYDVIYDAYIDRNDKGIRCRMGLDDRIHSGSQWYYIDTKGLVRFNQWFLMENLAVSMAIDVLPFVVLVYILISKIPQMKRVLHILLKIVRDK